MKLNLSPEEADILLQTFAVCLPSELQMERFIQSLEGSQKVLVALLCFTASALEHDDPQIEEPEECLELIRLNKREKLDEVQ